MENNLDDIKSDTLQEGDSKRTKRLMLIGVASAVLVVALIVVITFLTKKEVPQNPEFNIAELEKLADLGEDKKAQEVSKDGDLDRLIEELRSKPAEDGDVEKQEGDGVQVEQVVAENTQKQVTTPKQEATKQENKKSSKQENAKPAQQAKKPVAKNEAKPQGASQAFKDLGNDNPLPKGVYLQVGVFAGTPNAIFLEKIKKYSYKTQKKQKDGKVLTHYLIGPYPDRSKADELKDEIIKNGIAKKPTIVEIR